MRTHFSVVSPGTERQAMDFARRSLVGKARNRPDLVKQVLRKLSQEGPAPTLRTVMTKLDAPQPLGYACAGVVEAVGSEVAGFVAGDRVACAGAGYANHAEIVCVPKNLVARVPDKVSFQEACGTTLSAIALQGLRVGEVELGEKVAVIGLGLVGLILAIGGLVCLYQVQHDRPLGAMGVYAATSVIFVTAVFGFGTLRIDKYQYARGLMTEVQQHGQGPRELVGYRYIRESLVYYAGQPVEYVEENDQLRRLVETADNPYVLTTDTHQAEFESQFPGEFSVVARRDRFLFPGQIVVFARDDSSLSPHTATRIEDSGRL